MLRSQTGNVIWLLIPLPIVNALNGTLHHEVAEVCAIIKGLLLEHRIAVRNFPDRCRKRKSRGSKRINLNKNSLRSCGTEESFKCDWGWCARGSDKIGYQSSPFEEGRQSTLYQMLQRMDRIEIEKAVLRYDNHGIRRQMLTISSAVSFELKIKSITLSATRLFDATSPYLFRFTTGFLSFNKTFDLLLLTIRWSRLDIFRCGSQN